MALGATELNSIRVNTIIDRVMYVESRNSSIFSPDFITPLPSVASAISEKAGLVNITSFDGVMSTASATPLTDATNLAEVTPQTFVQTAPTIVAGSKLSLNDLAGYAAGGTVGSQLQTFINNVATYWRHQYVAVLKTVAAGVYSATGASRSTVNITSSSNLYDRIVDAQAVNTEFGNELTVVWLINTLYTRFAKLAGATAQYSNNQIGGVTTSPFIRYGNLLIANYGAKPAARGTPDTYLNFQGLIFRPGAFGFAAGGSGNLRAIEVDREPGKGSRSDKCLYTLCLCLCTPSCISCNCYRKRCRGYSIDWIGCKLGDCCKRKCTVCITDRNYRITAIVLYKGEDSSGIVRLYRRNRFCKPKSLMFTPY